ncbi:Transposable element Tc1 transposase [Cucumispora dikerogammari]|nr:Transposable element Tc1 transposase [Cucumispora dikerogammari]
MTNFKSRVPRKLPLLSKKNIDLRNEIAMKWSSFENEDWNKIFFSYETMINLFSFDNRIKVWREPKESLNRKNSIPTVKHGGKSIIIWGCMSSNGVGKLVFIESIMDKYQYKRILTANLKSSAKKMGIQDDFIFQQDNDPKHTSKYVQKYFEVKNIEVLEWPSQYRFEPD